MALSAEDHSWIPCDVKRVSFLQSIDTGSGVNPYPIDSGVFFSESKAPGT